MNALIVQRLVDHLNAPTLRMDVTKTGKIHYWKDGQVVYNVIQDAQMRPPFYNSDGFHRRS